MFQLYLSFSLIMLKKAPLKEVAIFLEEFQKKAGKRILMHRSSSCHEKR
jgi:hypothetical protein